MKKQFFQLCMDNLTSQEATTETVGLKGTYKKYQINFHGHLDNNFEMIVEDFGKEKSGKWIPMLPSQTQVDQMSERLQIEVDKVYQSSIERQEEADRLRQELRDEIKYGRPDTLYNEFY